MSHHELPADHAARMGRVRLALDGLSIGDAFGQQFFHAEVFVAALKARRPPLSPWRYTDDTVMALAIREVLDQRGTIDQELLAQNLAARYRLEPYRGYGSGADQLLREIERGTPWQTAAKDLFGGQGSFGNGGAMRVAPVGAYFADDYQQVVAQARASAEVTHAHPEGQAGAIAVAVACAWAYQWRVTGRLPPAAEMLEAAIAHTPAGPTQRGLKTALQLGFDEWEHAAANQLGNGSGVTAPDTVPFCLWCAAAKLSDFREALWSTVQVEGDMDTNCAIVGGIVALAVGRENVPDKWLRSREPLLLSSAPP
ncbi:MAG: ADP-ribosylglycohydrolase family protein [Pirellulales bacterium]